MTRPLSLLATREVIDLHTSFDYPPIPFRGFDWSAIDSNIYDADYDYERGSYVSNCAHGHGATEQEAIEDLLDQLEEQSE
jgi:hypothetical protein